MHGVNFSFIVLILFDSLKKYGYVVNVGLIELIIV